MPGQATSAYFDIEFPRRGSYRFSRWLVSTTAPLALSTAWRESIREQEILDVYPSLLKLKRTWKRMLPSRFGNVSTAAQRQGPADDVFFGLREYRHGDSIKRIHWRTTARLGEPAVRQFEQQQKYDLCLLVDGIAAQDPEQSEHAISLAATIAVELSASMGSRFMMVLAGEKPELVLGGASPVGLRRMLQALARIDLVTSPDLHGAIQLAASSAKHLPDLLVISPRDRQDHGTPDAERKHDVISELRQWKNRSAVRWFNASDPAVSSAFLVQEKSPKVGASIKSTVE